MLQHHAIQKLHGDVALLAALADVVNRADVRMVECRGGAGFPSEAFQHEGVSGNVIRQELERHKASQFGVLGLVDHAHPPIAELLDDPVACNGLADHGARILRW